MSTNLVDCQKCPRLHRNLRQLRQQFPHYHNLPVAGFGAAQAQLLIVGLAPGKHGANASGIPFTGDASGDFLWAALAAAGLIQIKQDGSPRLTQCRVTNAVKCFPPQNRPQATEINQCNSYLKAEIAAIRRPAIILSLGIQAHRATLKALELTLSDYKFEHGKAFEILPDLTLLDSYHCSRYNTQTRRLTRPMFDKVLKKITQKLDD